MKKRVLFLATLVVVISLTMGIFCTKNLAKADSVSNSKDIISYKITFPSNYYNGKKISKMILHYGVNGWNNVQEKTMYVTTDDYQHGIPATYNFNAIVKVRKGDTINYCLKIITDEGMTSWNNNSGHDFSVVANESNVKTINYEVNWLAQQNGVKVDSHSTITLHYGINGWDNPTDVKMELKGNYPHDGKDYTWYKAILTVEEGSTINYCVKADSADGEVWDNNNGNNYSVIAK